MNLLEFGESSQRGNTVEELLERQMRLFAELKEVRQLMRDYRWKHRTCSICHREKDAQKDFHQNAGNRCKECKQSQDARRYALRKVA